MTLCAHCVRESEDCLLEDFDGKQVQMCAACRTGSNEGYTFAGGKEKRLIAGEINPAAHLDVKLKRGGAVISFFIPGDPAPKGSKKGFVGKHTGRVVLVEQAGEKLKSWNRSAFESARLAMCEGKDASAMLVQTPIRICLYFDFVRPKGHYGKRGLLPSAPSYPIGRPDVDKLARATLDCFTGIVFDDDSRITELVAVKRYAVEGQGAGCHVKVFPQ